MEKMRVNDTDDAVSGVLALREILCSELVIVERLINRTDQTLAREKNDETEQILETYERVRTGLLSGLASVDEVLGWVRMLAPTDPDGNELDCVRSLPHVNVLPKH